MGRMFKKRILALMLMAVTVCLCVHFHQNREKGKEQSILYGETLQMQVLDVGQGQAVLFSSDGEYLLVDGGGRDRSSYLVSYLNSLGIDKLDYVIASHYDADHISGLIGTIYRFQVGMVIAPDYEADTDTYRSFQNALSARNLTRTTPRTGDTYPLGNAEFTIVSLTADMNGTDREKNLVENNTSVAVRVTNGVYSFLVTGDAQETAEHHMCTSGQEIQADVYVAGHHGSATSSTDVFLDQVSPETVIISCGKDNSYGHPAESTLGRFEQRNIQIFRTDTDGTVIVDAGESLEIICEKTDTRSQTAGIRPDYIVNENTKKFHRPDCESVKKISPVNYREYTGKREELTALGYTPCGNCDP